MAYVVALLVILNEGAPRARTMPASQLRDTFMQIKQLFKSMHKAEPLEAVPALSPNVVEFRASHPTTWRAVFGDHGWPGSIQVSFMDVSAVARAFRWRNERSRSDSSSGSGTGAVASVLGQLVHMLWGSMARSGCAMVLR